MRNITKLACVAALALLVALPVWAQDRGRPGSSEGGASGRSTPGDSGAGSSASIASRGISSSTTSTSSYSSATSDSRNYGSSGMSSYSSGGVAPSSSGGHVPNLQSSSFYSTGYYYSWENFLYNLQRNYFMNTAYFGRFIRNREPLVTPELLKLTVRQPLRLSMQLVTAADDLETMLRARESGKPVDKQAVAAKTQEIRELAKKIRQDQSLAFFDQRSDKDLLKGVQVDNLGLEAIAQLREMAQDLSTQLKNMYAQSQPSTISVQSLSQPSFESLTKGIDKLSKVIENSARRI